MEPEDDGVRLKQSEDLDTPVQFKMEGVLQHEEPAHVEPDGDAVVEPSKELDPPVQSKMDGGLPQGYSVQVEPEDDAEVQHCKNLEPPFQSRMERSSKPEAAVYYVEKSEDGVPDGSEECGSKDGSEEYIFDRQQEHGNVIYYKIQKGNVYMTWRDVIDMWKKDAKFCRQFASTLGGAPYSAFFWETMPCNVDTLENLFEMVLVDSPLLAQLQASPSHFREHFQAARDRESVVAFLNLGKDALLVAPCPSGATSKYAHIAAFVRGAQEEQKIDFWKILGKKLDSQLKKRQSKPIWVSTSGLGVPWLHARLDSYPKYYQHAPFMQPPVKQNKNLQPGEPAGQRNPIWTKAVRVCGSAKNWISTHMP